MRNQTTQSQTTTPEPDPKDTPAPITCWVGLDWADQKHCLAVRPSLQAKPIVQFVQQRPELMDAFFLELRAQHPQGRIAVCLEQSRGPVIYQLLKFDFLVIYPINPSVLANYRRALSLSGAKDDPLDAELLCDFGAKHQDRLRPLQPQDPCTRQLQLLVEGRRGFVEQRTGLSNQLGAVLKSYYPLALDLLDDLDCPMALEFLRRWPNLAKLQATPTATLRSFFYKHNSRSEERITGRLEAVERAKPLTEDPALIGPMQLQMVCLLPQLAAIQKVVATYDQRIKEVFHDHPDFWLFRELPGAGPALAPRLAAAFGTIRENVPEADDLLTLSGVAPVQRQSGASRTVHFRFRRPVFLHQTFVEFAKCSIGKCAWARQLYEDKRLRGKTQFAAFRAVAFKWIRILWACWATRTAYDETRYLKSLQQRGVALYESLYDNLPANPETL
jgi:transposase